MKGKTKEYIKKKLELACGKKKRKVGFWVRDLHDIRCPEIRPTQRPSKAPLQVPGPKLAVQLLMLFNLFKSQTIEGTKERKPGENGQS